MAETTGGRRSKLAPIEDAVGAVPDRSESLWVGGMHLHNVPMALVRECIRQGKHFETLYAGPSASFAADLLLGAAMVERVYVGYIGFEHLGPAPSFRRAAAGAEKSPIEFIEVDSGSLVLGLQAGAAGQPFAPLPPGIEQTGLPAASPKFYRQVKDPFSGAEAHAVPAIRPEVALIHCQQADEFGNGIFKGSHFTDRLLAMAAERVLMQVETVVPHGQVLKYPGQTGIPAPLVDALVQTGFGCHPASSHRFYNVDDVHIGLYAKQAATEEGFQEYLRHFVLEPDSQEEYMRRVQNQEWLSERQGSAL